MRFTLIGFALIGSVLSMAVANAAPILLGQVPGLDPNQLRITTFASAIGPIYGMARADDGSLLAGVSGQPFFGGGAAQVLRFVDANFDGIADGPGTAVIGGIPGIITAVQRVGALLAVGTQSESFASSRVSLFAPGATPDAPYALVGQLDFAFGGFWVHASPGLAVRATPGGPAGSFDLFVNVGSATNHTASGQLTVNGLGLSNVSVPGDSIFLFRVDTSAASPTSAAPVRIAAGIRNSVAMGFEPGTGDFYFVDNGIDGLVNDEEPLSADELNRISAASLAQGTPDFGFPNSYVTYRTGVVVGGGIQPVAVFQPLGDPFTGSESEGPGGLAFSPSLFPNAIGHGVFVGFHGRSCCVGLANEENPVVYVDLGTGNYYHFISNNDPNVAHIDSLFSTNDSLFLADLGSGTIYQISSVPEPATVLLAASALAALIALRRYQPAAQAAGHISPVTTFRNSESECQPRRAVGWFTLNPGLTRSRPIPIERQSGGDDGESGERLCGLRIQRVHQKRQRHQTKRHRHQRIAGNAVRARR